MIAVAIAALWSAARAPTVASQSIATRWVLMYAGSRGGSRPAYTLDELTRLVAVVDTSGRPQRWLNSGAIFLHMFAASGRVFTTWAGGTPADGGDWATYLDSLCAPGAALTRLDSAVAMVGAVAGPLPEPFPVSIMIPYPDRKIGALRFGSGTFDLTSDSGRAAAATAYVVQTRKQFAAARLRHLRLDGFYWLDEAIPPDDTTLVTTVARTVHAAGLRLLWIPFYNAPGMQRWRNVGIDAAWLQPNYFYHRELPAIRLDSAAERATLLGMGLEVEFDGRLYADPRFSDRLGPYLTTLALHPELRALPVVVYEGGGALIHLSRSRLPADREWYRLLSEALR